MDRLESQGQVQPPGLVSGDYQDMFDVLMDGLIWAKANDNIGHAFH